MSVLPAIPLDVDASDTIAYAWGHLEATHREDPVVLAFMAESLAAGIEYARKIAPVRATHGFAR